MSVSSDHHAARRPEVERRALRIVGWCFVLLAVYVTVDATGRLVRQEPPHESLVGILLAAVSAVVMPVLARAKRRVASDLGSPALTADATQTQLCTYLSAILLVGLGLNAVLGWWWADPIAGLAMVPIIAKEGYDAVRGRTCCATCH